MAEFGVRSFALDRKFSIDPDWRSVNMDFLVHRQRSTRCKWDALGADALVLFTQWGFLKENEGGVFLPQRFSFLGICLHEFSNFIPRHFFFLNDPAINQELSDGRIRHSVACDVVQAQHFSAVEFHPRRALNLGEEGIDWAFDIADFQAFSRESSVLDLGAIKISENLALTFFHN